MVIDLVLVLSSVVTLGGVGYLFLSERRQRIQAEHAMDDAIRSSVEDLLAELRGTADRASRELARQRSVLQAMLPGGTLAAPPSVPADGDERDVARRLGLSLEEVRLLRMRGQRDQDLRHA